MDSLTRLLQDDLLGDMVLKIQDGTLSDRDVDLFIVKQQVRTIQAGRIAVVEAIKMQEEADARAEQFLTTGDTEQLEPFFKQRDVRQ